MSETVIHEIEPVWNEKSRVLILGTLPSPSSRERGFFYMHAQNRFWKTVFSVFGEELKISGPMLKNCTENSKIDAIKERKDFLIRHNLALWDVLQKCDIDGASDSSIKNAVPNDFTEIFERADIKKVFCTGKTAFRFWKKFCAAHYEKKYAVSAACLPSTSPANAACSLEKLIEAYKVLLNYTD